MRTDSLTTTHRLLSLAQQVAISDAAEIRAIAAVLQVRVAARAVRCTLTLRAIAACAAYSARRFTCANASYVSQCHGRVHARNARSRAALARARIARELVCSNWQRTNCTVRRAKHATECTRIVSNIRKCGCPVLARAGSGAGARRVLRSSLLRRIRQPRRRWRSGHASSLRYSGNASCSPASATRRCASSARTWRWSWRCTSSRSSKSTVRSFRPSCLQVHTLHLCTILHNLRAATTRPRAPARLPDSTRARTSGRALPEPALQESALTCGWCRVCSLVPRLRRRMACRTRSNLRVARTDALRRACSLRQRE